MPENNRRYKRINKTVSVLYCIADDLPQKWDMSIVENISAGGVRFIAPGDLKLDGKILQLRIKLPELAPHLLEIQGMVVNVKPRLKGKQCDVSIKFVNISEENKSHLSVVEKMIERQEIKKSF